MPENARAVLVVEDDDELRKMLCDVFTAIGASECHAFDSVASLQSSTRALDTSVAILDVNLGQGNPTGVEAYQWLRTRGYQGQIIFLTGHARSYPPVQQAEKLEAAQVLQKPIDLETLRQLYME
jgi:CheY-like chemotaxis protein